MKLVGVNKQLYQTMSEFKLAYYKMLIAIGNYERATQKSVNDLQGFIEGYPFDKSFDELEIGKWVDDVLEAMYKPNFQVLNYRYSNIGGNTMVGVFDVWLPKEKCVVYMLTNEEGCTMSKVDYINNDLELDDYDEVTIEAIDYGSLSYTNKYFELYKHCLNEYTKSDCKYFGCTRFIRYELLSDYLQEQVTADYLAWLESEGCDVEVDGYNVVISPDYPPIY